MSNIRLLKFFSYFSGVQIKIDLNVTDIKLKLSVPTSYENTQQVKGKKK